MPVAKCFECGAELMHDPVRDILICPVCEPELVKRLEEERLAELLERERELLDAEYE